MMELRSAKKVRSVPNMVGRECDRLSEMPDEIIVHILSFLPIVEAVRTMLLRRFGNLWTYAPSLCFDHIDFYELFYTSHKRLHWTEKDRCYFRFIRKVMLLHRRLAIDKFELSTSEIVYCHFFKDSEYFDEARMWLTSALGKEVKALEFKVKVWGPNEVGNPILPKCIFTSTSLVTLKLSYVQIECNYQVHLRSLRKLSLNSVHISDVAFHKLISGCPYLQELEVKEPGKLVELRFANPSIKKLVLSAYWNCLQVLDSPNLKRLDLNITKCIPVRIKASSLHHLYLRSMDANYCCTFMEKFQDVEVMEFSDDAFKFFCESIEEIDVPRNKCKRLVLNCSYVEYHKQQLLAIYKLLTSSTRLEELVIYTESQSSWVRPNSHLDCPELSCCVMLPHLKSVTIHGCEFPNITQLLIEFLLKSAPMLDELLVVRGKHSLTTAVEENKFLKQVLSFQRASTKARVVIA